MPDRPEDVQAQLDRLHAEVAALHEVVHTRRVVVVDHRGRPRIVLSAGPAAASVRVDAVGGAPSVELYAADAVEADGPEVGVALVVDGEVVGGVHVLAPGDR